MCFLFFFSPRQKQSEHNRQTAKPWWFHWMLLNEKQILRVKLWHTKNTETLLGPEKHRLWCTVTVGDAWETGEEQEWRLAGKWGQGFLNLLSQQSCDAFVLRFDHLLSSTIHFRMPEHEASISPVGRAQSPRIESQLGRPFAACHPPPLPLISCLSQLHYPLEETYSASVRQSKIVGVTAQVRCHIVWSK